MQERAWCSDSAGLETSHVHIEGLDWSREKTTKTWRGECLAMIWGMEKFHYLLYGKHFILETDQKPLVSIYRKHMVEISPRIQRLVVRSFPYQPFDVQYRRGKGDSTSICFKPSISNTSGRRWDSASDCCSESYHLQCSCEFQ